ncbi:MAG: FxsA family protein [Gemmobacter sp.]
MARALFIAFGLIPLIEIALFVIVGRWIGVWATLGLVVLAAVAGSAILRRRGLAAAQGLRRFTGVQPIAEEALIAVAAVLLILPGFLTDIVALALLTPPIRRALIAAVAARVTMQGAGFGARPADQVIDGEFIDLDPPVQQPHPPAGQSGWTRH